MMIFKIIFFLAFFINNISSSEWLCNVNKIQHVSEQCIIIVEYENMQHEKHVCISHTLTIESLPPLSLKTNYTMKKFQLNFCQLTSVSQLPFSLPSTVEILDLSYNFLSTFLLSFPLSSNLKYIYLDSNPNLTDINFGNNRVQKYLLGLSLRHNQKLKLTSLPAHLTHLDLTDCNLQQSSILTLIQSLKQLTHLSLANNQLEKLPLINEYIQLEYLNISNNRLTLIENQWIHRSLRILDLTFNQIQSLEFLKDKLTAPANHSETINHTLQLWLYGNPLTCDCWLAPMLNSSSSSSAISITDLHLLQCHSRPILEISSNDFLCRYTRHCASDCSCCDFEACDCHSVCPSDCSCSHDAQWSRHIVKCSNINLTNIHLLLPETISELDYEKNSIEHIKPFVLIGKKSLKKLNLGKNQLKSIHNETFCAATNIDELNLSYNSQLKITLAKIDELFSCLKNLQTIILSKDQINKEEQISQGWMVFSNNNDDLVRLTRVIQKPTVISSTSTILPVIRSVTSRSSRPYPTAPVTMPSIYQRECTTFQPLTSPSVIRHISFIQHNQTLIIIVFFLLLFVFIFLILLITLAICRRKLRRHLTAELQRQRAHHYYYHHTRLHQPSTKTTDSNGINGTNDSLYEQLPSLSSDSEQPFLYNEKKSNNTNVPVLPTHPTQFRHHLCCHSAGRVLHPSTVNSHEYQYATTTTTATGYSTPTSQQHQCTGILVWANRLLSPTQNTYNCRHCTSSSSELQHLQQRLLSNQQDQTSIATDTNIMRYCNNETLFIPTINCQCHSHGQNTETYIYPHVHR